MPEAALSDVKIGQRACTRAGLPPVDSFDDGSPASIVLNDNYLAVVYDSLSAFQWPFAKKESDLGAPVTSVEVPSGYLNHWELPTNRLSVFSILVNGQKTAEYEIFTPGLVALNATDNETITCIHSVKTDEATWHPSYVEYVALQLAAFLSTGVTHDAKRAEYFQVLADRQLRKAKFLTGKQDTTGAIRPQQFLNTR